ncbi:MAG TPA: TIGR00282 family metallophosphoesterase [Melioribacteraceae bacterium]|nr:TIGR00282 family metallophosphoesterase [Melioribacteraceae bacterium]
MKVKILFIGDIVGASGLKIVETFLPTIKEKYNIDVIIANGENISDGKGCTQREGKSLFSLGVKVITGGNHTWDKPQSQDYLKNEPRSLRPMNYPKGTYGNGYYIIDEGKYKIGVLNLQGRSFMPMIDCPFRIGENTIKKISQETKIIIVDFHAEATAEKIAFTYFVDGSVSAVFGTHTHVQTSDERIFPKGTGFITDVGMTGPYDSVIGMKIDAAINRFIYQTPQKYISATENNHISAVVVTVDSETGKCLEIERIFYPEFDKTYEIKEEVNDGSN